MKLRNLLAISLTGISTLTFGQASQAVHPVAKPESPKTEATSKPPIISESLLHKFFKAQAEAQSFSDQAKQVAQEAQQKQAGFQVVIKELQDVCGKEFVLQMSKSGDPECAAKVEPKAVEKPVEPKK